MPVNMKLNPIQEFQVKASSSNIPVVNKRVIGQFLYKITEGTSYFSFNTFQGTILKYNNKPYQLIPFQYSIQIQVGEKTVHKEYIGRDSFDSSRSFAEQLLIDMPSSGYIVSCDLDYKKDVMKSLAIKFSDLRDSLLLINERFIDIMDPFRNGAFLLESLLPAMRPGYKKGSIQRNVFADSDDGKYWSGNETDYFSFTPELSTPSMINIVEIIKELVNR
jgi:hypothetical protein